MGRTFAPRDHSRRLVEAHLLPTRKQSQKAPLQHCCGPKTAPIQHTYATIAALNFDGLPLSGTNKAPWQSSCGSFVTHFWHPKGFFVAPWWRNAATPLFARPSYPGHMARLYRYSTTFAASFLHFLPTFWGCCITCAFVQVMQHSGTL